MVVIGDWVLLLLLLLLVVVVEVVVVIVALVGRLRKRKFESGHEFELHGSHDMREE